MRLEIVKNFLTLEECSTLNAWVQEGITNSWLRPGRNNDALVDTRMTTRFSGDSFMYPPLVADVSTRIRVLFGLENASPILGQGRDGVVVSCTFGGGSTAVHKDVRVTDDYAILRCNIMTQKPEAGGILHVDGQPITLEVGDLHCYLVSEHDHYVSPTVGNTPRILWMFGAQVTADAWNQDVIQKREVV